MPDMNLTEAFVMLIAMNSNVVFKRRCLKPSSDLVSRKINILKVIYTCCLVQDKTGMW